MIWNPHQPQTVAKLPEKKPSEGQSQKIEIKIDKSVISLSIFLDKNRIIMKNKCLFFQMKRIFFIFLFLTKRLVQV